MSRYLVAYDISNDQSRQRVTSLLLNGGVRLQRSVFEVWLEPDEIIELRRTLGPLLDSGDQLDIIFIDASSGRDRWHWGTTDIDCRAVIVVGEFADRGACANASHQSGLPASRRHAHRK